MEQKGTLRVLALGLAAALLISGCMSVAHAEDEAPVEPAGPEVFATAVEVVNLTPTVIRNELTYIGQVQPSKTISVAGVLGGEVLSVNFDVGDTVQEGDVLFTINAESVHDQIRTLQSSLAVQDVSVESAQYTLQTAINGSAEQRMRELEMEAMVNNAGYQAELAREGRAQTDDMRDFVEDALDDVDDYIKILNTALAAEQAKPAPDPDIIAELQKDIASAQASAAQLEMQEATADGEYDLAGIRRRQATSAFNDAQASLEAYRQAAATGQEQATQAATYGVLAAMAGRSSTETQLAILQSSLDDFVYTSPITGVVSARSIEVGQVALQVAGPFTIVQMDPVIVEVSVSETLINKIHVGDRVGVSLQALENSGSLTGTVTAVSPVANAGSTFPIRVELPNADHKIKPGMFSQVTFIEAQKDGVFVVEKGVVMRDETSEYVFVIKNGVAVKTPVTTGLTTGTQVEIVSGVSAADDIVVVGQEYLYADTVVNIVSRNGQRVEQ